MFIVDSLHGIGCAYKFLIAVYLCLIMVRLFSIRVDENTRLKSKPKTPYRISEAIILYREEGNICADLTPIVLVPVFILITIAALLLSFATFSTFGLVFLLVNLVFFFSVYAWLIKKEVGLFRAKLESQIKLVDHPDE